jgi:hypothetical protein
MAPLPGIALVRLRFFTSTNERWAKLIKHLQDRRQEI